MARERGDDVEQLTWSIPEYAKAVGISERQARYLLSRGEIEGVVRIGHRVLVFKQHAVDQLLRASGQNPYPEELLDAADAAAERDRQLAVAEKADAKGRERYAAMTTGRGDGPTEELVFK